jgi:hypothetical protein
MLEAEMIDGLLQQGYTFTAQKVRCAEVGQHQLWNKCKGHGNNTGTII